MSSAPLTLSAADCALVLVDFQARLLPAIDHGAWVLSRALMLAKAARLLDVPALLTEQNPAGLGRTEPRLAAEVPVLVEKMSFDSCRAPAFLEALPRGRNTVLVAGLEAHVCVLQTVLGLKAAGRRPVLVADAVGSRHAADKEAALARLRFHGVEVVTADMAVFEWLGDCTHPAFKAALALIR
ncbi:MAG TPA: isochorismatase family protein [Azospirillaceae bacterium]|nr:isochorismatase family protein [Azospirillaceae bacterium]